MKLALGIIVKDEFELVENIVDRYSQYFDEVVLAVDKDFERFRNAFDGKVTVIEYKWINDFSHKRNFLAENIKSPYYFRIDTDDDIQNPEKIREVFENCRKNDVDVVYFPYVYSKDLDGNPDALHWRETIIKKRSGIYWKKRIHENIFAENQETFRGVKCSEVTIIHNITPEHAAKSAERNFKYLVEEFEQDKERTDPRTLSYLGRVLTGYRQYKEAIPFLELLIEKSGWDDDKYFAWIHLSQCWQALGNLNQAIACCNEALEINTKFPDAFIQKGSIYLSKQEYDKALDWLMSGIVRPVPDTTFVITPAYYSVTARAYICQAYLGKGDFEAALKVFLELKKIAPSSEYVLKHGEEIIKMCEDDKYVKSVLKMIPYIGGDREKVVNLLNSVPTPLLKDERIWQLRNGYLTPKKWSDKSVVIYCGSSWEEWATPSTINGIGGSEEAVIYLSQELTKLGYLVTVYNNCGEFAGIYNGVEYRNHYEINPHDEFNVLIAWRGNIFKSKINAKKTYVWMHDVPYMDDMFTKADLENITKIIVLSEYHKSLLSAHIPDDKIFVSANGVNLKDFILKEYPTRNPHRIIYTSSYDRGLENLLTIWPDVKKEVPDAELHAFYGWNVWLEMEKDGTRDKSLRLRIQELMKQPGVFEHGRVGHKELIKEFYKSGVYAYPSHFEEISCISAMKAQTCLCVPVTTDYAALAETVKSGIKVSGKGGAVNEEYKKSLIEILKDVNKQEEIRKEMSTTRERFGWNLVAKQWSEEFSLEPALV